ncbi:MAG TPA: hypothetical protein VIY30_17145 [Burkholderiaceae bacterium]
MVSSLISRSEGHVEDFREAENPAARYPLHPARAMGLWCHSQTPARVANIPLTDDRRLRLSLTVTLVSLFTYVLYAGIGAVQVAPGTMDLRWLVVFGVAAVLVNGCFYLVIRSGRTRHLGDPAMGPLQLCTGVLFISCMPHTPPPGRPPRPR